MSILRFKTDIFDKYNLPVAITFNISTDQHFSSFHRYFHDGLKTIEHFGTYIEDLVNKLTVIRQNQFEEKIEKVLKNNEQNFIAQIANDNSEGQIVLSGKTDDLDKLIIILKENTIKNIKLPVSAPFHCNLMSKATNIMNEELDKLNFIEGKNKLISNVTANEISSTGELKDLLVKQIENRVRWRESVINMINSNVNHFIEIGPGKVLSGLVKRINKEVKIDTINNQGDIEGLKI